jgi:nucleoside-diphosphate-sugar epimerase
MRVLIAGAGGVIGLALTERLVADGHTVIGLTRSPDRGRAIRAAGGETILCDVLLQRQAAEAVAKAQPDAIIHELSNLPPALDLKRLSAQLAPTNRLRREGTRNLIAAARTIGVQRLLAQSIAFAYAPAGDWVKSESAPLALDAPPPQDEVVSAVCDLERQVLDASGIVLRYGNLYGADTYFGARGAYAQLAAKRQLPIVGAAEGRWSFVHTRDAADATALALEHGEPGIYNVVDDDPAPSHEWIPVFAQALGAKRPLKVPAAIGSRLLGSFAFDTMTRQRGASNAKARTQLHWTPGFTSWREGFAAAIAAENRERWRFAR